MLDHKDLKNAFSIWGEMVGFCGAFSKDEILKKIAEVPLNRAKMVVINFTTAPDKPMENLLQITKIIGQKLPEEAQMVFGVNTNKDLKEKIKIWLVATGI